LKASTAVGNTYQWLLDGSPIPGATDAIYFPTTAGNYRCTITNTYGCARNTAIVAVTACRADDNLGAASGSFTLNPNPASNTVNLQLETGAYESTIGLVQIFDLSGRLVLENNIDISNGTVHATIDISAITADGMYIVEVVTANTRNRAQLVITR